MGIHEVSLSLVESYGGAGGPAFNTKITTTNTGAEQRIATWAGPRRFYDLSYAVRTYADLNNIYTFFLLRNGSEFGWRYRDPRDHASTADGRLNTEGGALAVNNQDQTIATADGVQTNFQLIKTYSDSLVTRQRRIRKPIAGTVVIAFGAVAQTTGWTVDTTTGIVTFTTPPPLGTYIRAGYEFEVPVRFGASVDADGLRSALEDYGSSSIPSIPVEELLDEETVDEEFHYGKSTDFGVISADVLLSFGSGRVQRFQVNTAGLKLIIPAEDAYTPEGAPIWYLINNGSQSIDLKNAAGTLVKTLAASSVTVVINVRDASSGQLIWYAF